MVKFNFSNTILRKKTFLLKISKRLPFDTHGTAHASVKAILREIFKTSFVPVTQVIRNQIN